MEFDGLTSSSHVTHHEPLTLADIEHTLNLLKPIIEDIRRNRLHLNSLIPYGQAFRLEPDYFGEFDGIHCSEETIDGVFLQSCGIEPIVKPR